MHGSGVSVEQLISERVHQLMFRNRLTQTRLAPQLGMTQSALSAKLRNRRGWTIDELVMAAAVMGVSLTDILQPVLDMEKPAQHELDGTGNERARPEGLEPPTFCSDAHANVIIFRERVPAVQPSLWQVRDAARA